MESRTSRNEESRSRNNISSRQGSFISVVCIIYYFFVAYSATGLILMAFFVTKDFMHFAIVLLFASLTICLYCAICNVKPKSKVAPEDCEKGTTVSQKYVKSHVINLGTFNNTEIRKVIKVGLKPKRNPNKRSKSCPSLPILNQIEEIPGEKPKTIPTTTAVNVRDDLAQIHV